MTQHVTTPDLCYADLMATNRETMVYLPFGSALRARREFLGYTQAELGDLVEVGQGAISKWEGRSSAPRDRFVLSALAEALGTTIEALVEGEVPAYMLHLSGYEARGENGTHEPGESEEEERGGYEAAIREIARNRGVPEEELRDYFEAFEELTGEERAAVMGLVRAIRRRHRGEGEGGVPPAGPLAR